MIGYTILERASSDMKKLFVRPKFVDSILQKSVSLLGPKLFNCLPLKIKIINSPSSIFLSILKELLFQLDYIDQLLIVLS